MLEKRVTIMNDDVTHTGIGQYSLNLASVLVSEGYKINYVAYESGNFSEPGLKEYIVDSQKKLKHKQGIYMLSGYNLFAFRRFLAGAVHITSQSLVPLGIGRNNVAITIHDLTRLHVFGMGILSAGTIPIIMKSGLLSKYNLIAVDSNYVKQDILEHFKAQEDNIFVLHNWIDLSKIRVSSELKVDRADRKIRILHVGNDFPHKNVNLVYRLLETLPENFELIRVGMNTLRNMKYIRKRKLQKRVMLYQGITEEKLENLYNSADLFFYPSSFEGFGRPLLEAMAHGLPVVYRNSSSLPEIAGEAGIPFDGDDLNEIRELVYRATDPTSKRILAQRSMNRSIVFDLKNQRSNILKFYELLSNSTNTGSG